MPGRGDWRASIAWVTVAVALLGASFLGVSLVLPAVAEGQGAGASVVPVAPPPRPFPRGVGTRLGAAVARLTTDPKVARAHWGVAVAAMDGTPLYGLDEGQFFQPASNAKLFTTAAAMALLGPELTFETKVVGVGSYSGGSELKGDVVLLGAGDANLSGRAVPYVPPTEGVTTEATVPPPQPQPLRYLEAMADQVAASGLRVVDGDVVGDDTLWPYEPYPEDWAQDDLVWGYGAPVSALAVNDNQIEVTVSPGATTGARYVVALDPAVPAYYTLDASQSVTGMATVGNHVQIERAPGSRVLRLFGGIGLGTEPDVEEVAIADPAEYAAVALKGMLEARGIRVSGAARARHAVSSLPMGFLESSKQMGEVIQKTLGEGQTRCPGTTVRSYDRDGEMRTLASHVSATVGEDVVVTNKVSQNLHAEMLLHQLGRVVGCAGSTADGAGVVRGFLAGRVGIAADDFVFYDGSGLSGHDLVTPRATVALLTWASRQPWFAAWKASLPVGGVDGSLHSRFAKGSLKGRVFAKTGTLGEARALSGYVVGASGRTVAFSVMVTDHAPGEPADREVMDHLVEAIAAAT